ncbi:MAG: cation transporter [Pirellulaceae bacterium]|nr:cation transporter [Pirellulaceae bacterium]
MARKYNSQALEADALYFSTDVWSSLVVLLGLVGVRLSGSALGWTWMEQADSVAALGVALIVVYVSVQLGKKCISDLLDAVPDGLRREVACRVREIEGVEGVRRVRLRRSGADHFADVTVSVDRARPFAQTHEIADRVEGGIRLCPTSSRPARMEPRSAPRPPQTKRSNGPSSSSRGSNPPHRESTTSRCSGPAAAWPSPATAPSMPG